MKTKLFPILLSILMLAMTPKASLANPEEEASRMYETAGAILVTLAVIASSVYCLCAKGGSMTRAHAEFSTGSHTETPSTNESAESVPNESLLHSGEVTGFDSASIALGNTAATTALAIGLLRAASPMPLQRQASPSFISEARMLARTLSAIFMNLEPTEQQALIVELQEAQNQIDHLEASTATVEALNAAVQSLQDRLKNLVRAASQTISRSKNLNTTLLNAARALAVALKNLSEINVSELNQELADSIKMFEAAKEQAAKTQENLRMQAQAEQRKRATEEAARLAQQLQAESDRSARQLQAERERRAQQANAQTAQQEAERERRAQEEAEAQAKMRGADEARRLAVLRIAQVPGASMGLHLKQPPRPPAPKQ